MYADLGSLPRIMLVGVIPSSVFSVCEMVGSWTTGGVAIMGLVEAESGIKGPSNALHTSFCMLRVCASVHVEGTCEARWYAEGGRARGRVAEHKG